ncbi:MAG: hypothetical protein J6X18_02725 [Bacteroidales bacterium]|nr:hypothetical protein [Bacteroidales bacterium]
MKKDEIFFGAQGLTSTHANYLSNVAKELYQQLEKELANVRFYNKYMTLIGTNTKDVICEGRNTVSDFNEKLDRVAKLKSLISWLREAISAKSRLTKEAEQFSYADFGIELPERPVQPTYLTEDDVIGTWGVKQRNRYYYLETLCAQYGKFIHPDGTFSNAREELYDRLNNPRTVSGNGRDTIVYVYEPSISTDEVESKFMELQNKYREFQAELNSMKHEIEVAIADDKQSKLTQFEQDWKSYENAMLTKDAELKSLKQKALQTVQALRIVIPNSLKAVYEEVSAQGK